MLSHRLSGINIIGSRSSHEHKLGIALVGLGGYASNQLAPALLETQYCELKGIVSGTPAKQDKWADQYKIPSKNIYDYNNFDDIADNDDIDIVYVVLPNSMHAEYTIRAARAGKHVICEKPMANNYEDCVSMIDACKKANRKLSIGYRLHFEPHNLEVMRLGQKKVFGKVKEVDSGFGFIMNNLDQWRAKKEYAGGGPLMDVGIYAIQSMIYTLGRLPKALQARDTTIDTKRWTSVEGSLEADFTYDSGPKASIKTSYEDNYCYTRSIAEAGHWELSPAYFYDGLSGTTSNGKMDIQNINQQAAQMDAFAQCILKDKESVVSGMMGARDMFIIDRMYESVSLGKEVSLKGIPQILHLV